MRILFSDLVEVLADLCIQTNTQVVVKSKLTVLVTYNLHLPTVQ